VFGGSVGLLRPLAFPPLPLPSYPRLPSLRLPPPLSLRVFSVPGAFGFSRGVFPLGFLFPRPIAPRARSFCSLRPSRPSSLELTRKRIFKTFLPETQLSFSPFLTPYLCWFKIGSPSRRTFLLRSVYVLFPLSSFHALLFWHPPPDTKRLNHKPPLQSPFSPVGRRT